MSDKIIVKNIVVQLLKIFLVLIICFEIVYFFFDTVFSQTLYEVSVQISTLVFVLFLGILGISQSSIEIQTRLRKAKLKLDDDDNENPKYLIQDEEKSDIINLIKKVLSQKKLFTDPNLKLEQFARKIHVSPRKLSIVVNDITGDNFSNFLNTYRIDEAKKLLLNEKEPVNMEKIFVKAGFNSRSTFFRVFKSLTGLTPQEFKSKNTK